MPPVAEPQVNEESPPSSMASWMSKLPSLDEQPPAQPKEEKQNASEKPAQPDGTDKSKVGESVKPDASASAAKPAAVPAADPKAGEKPAVPVAAKPAEQPAAKPAEAHAAAEEDKRPTTADDWERYKLKDKQRQDALRQELAAKEARLKELEEKVSKAPEESRPVVDPEVDRIKKLNEELTEKIMVLDVTQDPRFQEYFNNKTNAQIELAKKIVGSEKAEAVTKALQLPDDGEFGAIKAAQLEEIIQDLNPLQQSRIGSVLNALTAISDEKSHEIAKAKDLYASKQAKDGEARKQGLEARTQVFSKVVKSLQDKEKGFPAYIERENDDAWNQSIKQRIEVAQKLVSGEGMKADDIMKAALHAAAMPAILEAYKSDITERDGEIAKLKAQVAEMQAAQPSNTGRTAGRPAGEPPAEESFIKEGMNPFEASAAFAKRMSRAARGEE